MKQLIYHHRLLLALILAGILIMCFSSCVSSHLHYSGNYTITSLRGDTATFRFVRGKYSIHAKGLKEGGKVYLKRTFKKEKATVFLIK